MYDQLWRLFPREGWSTLHVEHNVETDQKVQKIAKYRSSPYDNGRGYDQSEDCLESMNDGIRRILQQGIIWKQYVLLAFVHRCELRFGVESIFH